MAGGKAQLTPRQFAGVVAVLAGAVTWFAVAMAVRDKPLVEAVGETAGATTAFLVLVSLAGVTRR